MYSPNSGDAGSREQAGSDSRGERKSGEDGFSVEKHSGEVCEEKFLFVVMVTGSVVCSENISLALRLDQDPAAPR